MLRQETHAELPTVAAAVDRPDQWSPALAVAREGQVEGLPSSGIRPAHGDHLLLGEEADAVFAAHLEVAESRAARAAEREVTRGHRDGHVDPDHGNVHFEL